MDFCSVRKKGLYMAKKIYAVKAGRQTGLFTTWDECEAQVKGFAGAKFKGFGSKQEAEEWLAGKSSVRNITKKPSSGRENTADMKSGREQIVSSVPDRETDFIIYTDGSCLRNPDGPGGWAAVIIDAGTGEVRELHEGNPSTTNNRMELSAAIAALSAVEDGTSVTLYTDSQYMKNAFTRNWIRNWKRNGWKTSKGTDVLNKELWLKLDELFSTHQVYFKWVKGHAGNTYNERCDVLARTEAMKY